MPPLVMIIRHAEKPVPGQAHGVAVDGSPDPESLTPRGWQRAGALIGLFVPTSPRQRKPRLPAPTHLFASKVGPGSSSKRPLETLQPLAERLNLSIDTSHLKHEVGQLASAVVAVDGVVLISWEHHLIPAIADFLMGNAVPVPQIWPDDRFDVVWIVDLTDPGHAPTFRQVHELLLGGDSRSVIARRA